MVTVTVTDSDGNTASDSRSLVIRDADPPAVELVAPNGHERLCGAEAYRIQWNAEDNHRIEHVDLDLSIDGGATFNIGIAAQLTGVTSFLWTPPATAAEHCRVRIRAFDPSGNVAEDISNSEFVLTTAPQCPDPVPPGRVGALRAIASGDCVRLLWEAPVDSTLRPLCSGECSPWAQAASAYRIRFALAPILTESEFSSATPVAPVPAPSAPGDLDSVAVSGLMPGSFYFFAVRAVDGAGNESVFDTLGIYVPLAIRADAGNDTTVECVAAGHAGTQVRLDGGRSEGTGLSFAWSASGVAFDDCSSMAPIGTFPLGSNLVILTVNHGAQTSRDTVVVTVRDSAPPTLELTIEPPVLWPPNEKLIGVHVRVNVEDSCDADVDFVLTSITRNCVKKDEGKEDLERPDIVGAEVGTPDVDFQLRAEECRDEQARSCEEECKRSCRPKDDKCKQECKAECEREWGRSYTIVYTATDHMGNAASATAVLRVEEPPMAFKFKPHDLNLESKGKWVSGQLEPAPPRVASQINVASIRLNGVVPVSNECRAKIEDHDTKLKVKFLRAKVMPTLKPGGHVPVVATGMIAGEWFEGVDYIKVKAGRIHAPTPGSVLAAGTMTDVTWDTGDGLPQESVALLSSFDNGATWTVEASGLANTGSYTWRVPSVATAQALLEIVLGYSTDEVGVVPESELAVSDLFTIAAPAGVENGEVAFSLRPTNPVTGPFTVGFSLVSDAPATLVVYDIGGRQVAVREVGSLGVGSHTMKLSVLPTGLYIVRLSQAGRSLSSRVVVIR